MPKVFSKQEHPASRSEHTPQEDSPIRTLAQWTAPSRPYRKKDKSYYRTIAIIVVLVIVYAFLMQDFILIAAVLALVFVVYVLGFVPPEDVNYKVSTQGLTIGDHFYFWSDMDSFWFSQKDGFNILNILTNLRFPAQLIILTGSENTENIKNIVARYLPFHEIEPKTLVDKWSDRLQRYFPLEQPR